MIAAVMIVIGIIGMSVGSAFLAKLKTKAEKDKSPALIGVVIGPVMIAVGVGLAIATGVGKLGSNNAAAMVGTAPGAAAGSAAAPNANPVVAIKHAAINASHALANEAEMKKNIANAASQLNALVKENGA
jgi:hypothetical protein